MVKLRMRQHTAATRVAALFVVGVGVLVTGCSRPEETPTPSPSAASNTAPAGTAAGGTATNALPGGPQGDAAYYSKTYGGSAQRPR